MSSETQTPKDSTKSSSSDLPIDASNNEDTPINYAEVPIFRAQDELTSTPIPLRGEVAYQPPPVDPLAARFGYNVLQVKRPITYWQSVRKYHYFSYRYVGIQTAFLLGCAYLITVINEEMRSIQEQNNSTTMAMAGEVLGKQQVPWDKREQFTKERQDELLQRVQSEFLAGKENKPLENYSMVKIMRPKEFQYENVRKR